MNVRDMLEQLGVPFVEHGQHRHTTEGWANIDCNQCSPRSGKFKLGVNLAYGNCSCWTCGKVNLFDALVNLTGLSRREMAKSFKGLERSFTPRDTIKRGTLKLPNRVFPMLPAHRKYLEGRGFDPDELSRLWGVQGIGKAGRLGWRLFIPIHFRGEVVSWTTRSIGEGHSHRYVSASPEEEAIPHKRLLYGLDFVRHTAVCVEGPTDAWRIGPGAVATFGTSFTAAQLALLSKIPRIVILYDAEPAAQRQARAMASAIAPTASEVFVATLPASDPGNATRSEIRLLRRRFLDE